ncbi:MAG: nitroreductase family protein [Polyangia bacterium]
MRKPAPTEHPVHDLARERWSPRAFSGRPIPEAELASLLEAARWAPSSRNSQPWRFIAAHRKERAKFDGIGGCLVDWNRGWADGAAVLLVACARTHDEKNRLLTHAWYDTGQAMAWMTVEATARGLRVHQMGGFNSEKVREACDLPDEVEPVVVAALGYPTDPDRLAEPYREQELAERKRHPLESIAFSGRWKEPLPTKE